MLQSPHSSRAKALTAAFCVLGWLTGCETRDRLIFQDPSGPGSDGPSSVIDVPAADTTVTAGTAYFVTGLVTDPSGIDTIYFDTEGGLSAFQPEIDVGTSFRFGLPLTTSGLAGDTITVRVYATDSEGNRGDTASRKIAIQ